MQTKKTLLLVLSLSLLIAIAACKQSTSQNNNESAAPQINSSIELPPVPEAFLFDLYEKVDHIDYFFRYTNFSVSQDEKSATQAFISTLSPGEAKMHSDTCQSPLRLTFLSEGNILVETEMYMTQNCQYVEYYVNNQKTYRSSHSKEGYSFLMNIFQQAQNAPRPE